MSWPEKPVPQQETPEQRAAEADHAWTHVQHGHVRRTRERIEKSRDNLLWSASRLALQNAGRRMSGADWQQFQRETRFAADLEQRAAVLRQVEREKQAHGESVRVIAEPRVYAPDSPHSYFLDVGTVAVRDEVAPTEARAAEERLQRYDTELVYEVRRGSPEGKRVLRALREEARDRDVAINQRKLEERAIGTGGGATASAAGGGAAFVSPYFITEAWAPFRGSHRVFADQCTAVALPPYGLELYLPTFSSTAGTSMQTEGGAITETDPRHGVSVRPDWHGGRHGDDLPAAR